MDTEWIIIAELITVLAIVLLISIVVWRDKSKEAKELQEVNDALLSQLQQMQAIIDGKKEAQEHAVETLQSLDDELDIQVNSTLDSANNSLGDMERLVHEHRGILTDLDTFLNESDPDLINAKKEINKLKALLTKTEKETAQSKSKLSNSESSVKRLKAKMHELSQQMLTMNTLEVSEVRLKRDQARLTDRIEALKEKYDNQKLIARHLESELKTSFKATEVQIIRDDLKHTEETLQRIMVEKSFIEKHFLELANNPDPIELERELKRLKREMRQLEKGILDEK